MSRLVAIAALTAATMLLAGCQETVQAPLDKGVCYAIGTGPKGEEVFNEKRNIFFKSLHVSRFFDEASQTIVYLTWSDKLIEGSPKNSISAVTPMPWGTQEPGVPKLAR